jgi:putative hydrolase of the HAD superfamily
VLSNTNHAHWRRLAPPAHVEAIEYPTPRMVRHLHASHLMGLSKPDEAIYREFSRRTGFAPERIVFFDDMEENIIAAQRTGWKAVQVDHAGDTVAQMSRVLESMGVFRRA